jgi:hypothetical protein
VPGRGRRLADRRLDAVGRGAALGAALGVALGALALAGLTGLAAAPRRAPGRSPAAGPARAHRASSAGPVGAADTTDTTDTTDTADFAALRRHVLVARERPFDAVRRAVLSHALVLLGDVHPALEPKRLVRELLRDSAVSSRLDAVALEIPASAQRWIGAYLQSDPEDPALLFREEGALRSLWGGSDEWLAIFHELWRLQRTRARPLDVIAMDLPGWPARARSPRAAVEMFAERDSAMAATLLDALAACDGCAARGGPRVLAFLGGYHVLRGLEADLSIGTNSGRVIWLATRLERRGVHPYTVLADGLPRRAVIGGASAAGATRVFDVLARAGWPPPPYAVETDSTFDGIAHAVREPDDPGDVAFTLRPGAYRLSQAVDLFVYWGQTTPLGANRAPRAVGRE